MTKITKRQVYYLCQAHTHRSKGDYKRYLGSLAQRLKQASLEQPSEHEGDARLAEADSTESVCTMPIARLGWGYGFAQQWAALHGAA